MKTSIFEIEYPEVWPDLTEEDILSALCEGWKISSRLLKVKKIEDKVNEFPAFLPES